MEKVVDAVFLPNVMEKFLADFRLDRTHKLLGDFENYVYEVHRGEETYILRITHSSHRSEEEIVGEIKWIHYLHDHGANVPVVFPSKYNRLVEKMLAQDGTLFFACLYSKVPGSPVRVSDDRFHDHLFQSWGKEIGKLHRLEEMYSGEKLSRKQWYQDDLFDMEQYVPNELFVIKQKNAIMEQLKKLPCESYGLIHNDVHNGNFFYDGKEIHIFDFDDTCYFWFVSDIAIPLYYACYALFNNESTMDEKQKFAKKFLTHFLAGYEQEHTLPKDWEEQLVLFLKVRDITLYAALNKKIAPEDRTESLEKEMLQLKERIERNEPIVLV